MRTNNKKYFYNFDVNDEYKIYKNIGSDQSMMRTYMEWKNHIVEKYCHGMMVKKEDLIYFLKQRRREEENTIAFNDTVWISMNILVVTIYYSFVLKYTDSKILGAIFILIALGLCAGIYGFEQISRKSRSNKIHFYEDMEAIIEENFEEVEKGE